MDNTTAIYYAKQALLMASSLRKVDTVLYGSCAEDLYLPRCMRLCNDIDMFLVAGDASPLASHLDDFLASVAEFLGEVSDCATSASFLWSVNMTSNGLLCAHVYVNRCHFSDITLIPAWMNSRFEQIYPREWTNLYLSAFGTLVAQCVISLNEVVYRMFCTARSAPLVDGLPCIPRPYNKPAIIKNTLRLQRLRILNDMGAVCSRPSNWVFDLNHEFDTLEQHCALMGAEGDVSITSVASATPPRPDMESLGLELVTLPPVSIVAEVRDAKHAVAQLQESFKICSSALFACLDTASARMNSLNARMNAVEMLGSKLAMRLNCRLQSAGKARDALKAAASMVSSLRTATYLTGTKPILAVKRIINVAHEKILPIISIKHVERPASVGDYLEANERIAKEMAERSYLPFNLIPESMAPEKMSKVGAEIRGGAHGARTDCNDVALDDEFWRREACAIRGMGMNLMGAFVVFYKMLQISGKLDGPLKVTDSVSEPEQKEEEEEASVTLPVPSVPFSYWSEKRHFLLDLVTEVDTIREFRLPDIPYIPAVSAADGRMEFITSLKECDVATIRRQVPALDAYNAEFMLSMLGNMIGYIHMPIIGHVQSLQDGLGGIAAAVGEMQLAAEECVEEFAKAPFMKHVQQLRELTFTLTSLAESIGETQPHFSWRKSEPFTTKKKKNRKKKKQGGGSVAMYLNVKETC